MLRRYMSTAAKVAEQKRMCPQFYCPEPRCLWRVKHTGSKDTPCPRHSIRTVRDARQEAIDRG
jgi:hypothetical protein